MMLSITKSARINPSPEALSDIYPRKQSPGASKTLGDCLLNTDYCFLTASSSIAVVNDLGRSMG